MDPISTQALKQPPLGQSLPCIQPQQLHRYAARDGNRRDALSIEAEMIGPSITPRMKQKDSLTRMRIDRGDIASFVPITRNAGVCEVLQSRKSAMLAADYVVYLVREAGVVLMDQAVFAAIIRAHGYFSPELPADITGHKKGFGEPAPLPFS